jgi:hypothetical protein
MTVEIVRISPESLKTLFLRKEDGTILLTENGRRIVIQQIVPEGFEPVRVYDYEKQQNENKRQIQLIDRQYRNQVVEEFKRSFRT